PDMNGLQLVEEIRLRYPFVPVILMTKHGSEDLAIQALQRGAASYVPKVNLARDLLETAEGVLEVAQAKKLIKIGAKVVGHSKYVIYQLAEVAVPRQLFAAILERIARLRLVCASG
ncbi:MAG TPA: response regulator, partial [Gemmataceae bacterium]|nr:response regulator [Gemmataceae bacterium]